MKLERPAGNASRKAWAAYAEALGLEPGDKTRDEIIELVSASEAAFDPAPAEKPEKPEKLGKPELPWAKIIDTPVEGISYIVAVRQGPYARELVDVSPYPGWQGPAQLSVSLQEAVSIRDALTLALKTFGIED